MLVGPARRTSIAGRQHTRFLSNIDITKKSIVDQQSAREEAKSDEFCKKGSFYPPPPEAYIQIRLWKLAGRDDDMDWRDEDADTGRRHGADSGRVGRVDSGRRVL